MNVSTLDFPSALGYFTQSYVSVVLSASGRFSVGHSALSLDNATIPASVTNVVLPVCNGAPDPPGCP